MTPYSSHFRASLTNDASILLPSNFHTDSLPSSCITGRDTGRWPFCNVRGNAAAGKRSFHGAFLGRLSGFLREWELGRRKQVRLTVRSHLKITQNTQHKTQSKRRNAPKAKCQTNNCERARSISPSLAFYALPSLPESWKKKIRFREGYSLCVS